MSRRDPAQSGPRMFYELAKPGIVYGNALPLVAGFLLASAGHFDAIRFVAALVGQSLIIGGACVFNNVMDRSIDARMQRTAKRPLVTGAVPVKVALAYGTVLTLLGSVLLQSFTNPLTLVIGLFGLVSYVLVYGYFKRRSTFGTLVGCVPGALPPVAGYVAVTGRLDLAAAVLFAILVTWQLPHFFSIALFRRNDYAAAQLPVVPVVRSARNTKRQIIAYIAAFTVAALALAPLGGGVVYAAVVAVIAGRWLWLGLAGLKSGTDDVRWARRMFGFSLVTLISLCGAIALSPVLP